MHAYSGSVHNPFPPQGSGGWAVVGYGDALARQRAEQLSQYIPGGQFPCWHYHDELLSSGLCRFFAFEAPDGRHGIGAMRYVGGAGNADLMSLGLAPGDPTGPPVDTSGDGSGNPPAGKTDTGGGLPSGDGIQCDAPAVPNAAGTACITPGGGTSPPLPKPPPGPGAPASGGSSSSSSGLVIAIVAALAVAGTIVAASAAKHPVRFGHTRRA